MNRNYLIVIGLGIATILAFLLINYFSQSNSIGEESEELEIIRQEMESLDNAILELEIINETQDMLNGNLKNLLNEKYTQLNQMEEKIQNMESKVKELEQKGQLDEQTIDDLKQKLIESKGKLIEVYKKEINVLVYENAKITAAMDSAVMEVNNSDSLILALTRENETFEKALLDCNDADKIEDIPMPEVAKLEAVNFEFTSIPKNANSGSKTVLQYDKRNRLDFNKLERLNICFSLEGNKLVPSGNKKIYLFLTNPFNETYTSKNLSGQTLKDGVTAKYTRASEVNYQQSTGKYNVCMDFIPSGESKFNLGRHRVEIVYGGKVIGVKNFWIRN